MPKVWNITDPNRPKDAVYVGRGTKWGNPFRLTDEKHRKRVLEAFREWFSKNKYLLPQLHELKGKDLVCHCAPKLCHADVLLEMANGNSCTAPEKTGNASKTGAEMA